MSFTNLSLSLKIFQIPTNIFLLLILTVMLMDMMWKALIQVTTRIWTLHYQQEKRQKALCVLRYQKMQKKFHLNMRQTIGVNLRFALK